MDTLLIFFLNRSFLNIVERNLKQVFLNSSHFCMLILNDAQNFKFIGFVYSQGIEIKYALSPYNTYIKAKNKNQIISIILLYFLFQLRQV